MEPSTPKFILLYGFLFTFCFSSAQSNYRSAKIVDLNGDTIRGLVNDKEWSKNPVSIWFKEGKTSKAREYFGYQVKDVMIDSGDYYVGAMVHLDRNYSTNGDMTQVYSDDSISKDTVFLRVLVKSRLSLYLYKDENGKEHYYMKYDTSDYHELISKKVPIAMAEGNGNFKAYIYEDKRYRDQLRKAMGDCADAIAVIDGVSYTENDLLKLFRDYNKCVKGNSVDYVASLKTLHAEWYIIGGLDVAQLYIDGTDYVHYLENGNYSKSYRPIVGIRGLFPLSRRREKYSMLMELVLRDYDTKANFYSDPFNAGYPGLNNYSAHFQMLYAKVNVALQYKYITKGVEPYLNLGFSGGYLLSAINNDESVIYIVSNNYSAPVNIGYAFEDPGILDLGYFASLGVRVKKFSAEIRYERSDGFVDNVGLGSRVKSFYFLLAYKISKY